jgi:hypothetical protein
MESVRVFNYGANAVCFRKNNHNYGMICSWATQVDYDKIVMLIGAQSVVEVIDIHHLAGIEEDNLIYGLIKSYTKGSDDMLTVR